jgi:hypothetical protein
MLQMRNVDDTVGHKIVVAVGRKMIKSKRNNVIAPDNYIYESNATELSKIKLRLTYSKVLDSMYNNDQDEYNYVRAINISLDILSKADYIRRKDTHPHFIESPDEYFKRKGVWLTWYDFMGTDTTQFINSVSAWMCFCRQQNIKSVDEYTSACDIYACLPRDPSEFYRDFYGGIWANLKGVRTRR